MTRSFVALLLCSAFGAIAADDKPATPPSPTLAQALRTNAVGQHVFSPAWTGRCSVVHATGIFTHTEPPVLATNRYRVKFDTVVVAPKGSIGNVGPRGLARADKDGGYSALHTQREELPGDLKLQSAKTLADLEKLLGPSQGFAQSNGESDRVNWSAFALKDAALDTVQVNAVVEKRPRARDAHIHSIEILRGKAAIEVKTSEKEKKSDKKDEKSNDKKSEKKD